MEKTYFSKDIFIYIYLCIWGISITNSSLSHIFIFHTLYRAISRIRTPATQSSEYGPNPAYRAVEGPLGTITHTGWDTPAWLQVDLIVAVVVHSVKIYNRLSNKHRLYGASILISKDASITRYTLCGMIRSTTFQEKVCYCKIVGR